jgi:hypothetical protein
MFINYTSSHFDVSYEQSCFLYKKSYTFFIRITILKNANIAKKKYDFTPSLVIYLDICENCVF